MAAIEVRGLTKHFGPILAVDHLSFDVEQGSITGFLGPNGAGKTTTLRMLLGLVHADEGTATFGGERYVDLASPLHRVGAVLEAANFYPGRTARNHLRIQALAGAIAPGRVDEVLGLVGLRSDANRRVSGYSLGMRQRLGIATALLGEPEVLVLDEPANGLDPEGVRWLRDLLRSLANKGRTVLISSHILAEVAQTVDRVVILDRGRLVAHSSLDELTSTAHRVVRVRTSRAEELGAALATDSVRVKPFGPEWIEVTGATSEQIGMTAAQLGIPIFESRSEDANLEDVFLKLTETQGKGAQR
jgi:ABC-2 type transport system ATP-binding protein